MSDNTPTPEEQLAEIRSIFQVERDQWGKVDPDTELLLGIIDSREAEIATLRQERDHARLMLAHPVSMIVQLEAAEAEIATLRQQKGRQESEHAGDIVQLVREVQSNREAKEAAEAEIATLLSSLQSIEYCLGNLDVPLSKRVNDAYETTTEVLAMLAPPAETDHE